MDSRINLDIEVDIDDIEGLEDNQGVADTQNNHVDHMAAYRVVDTDQAAVDNLGDLDNLKSFFGSYYYSKEITLRMIARMSGMPLWWISGRTTLMSRSTRCIWL